MPEAATKGSRIEEKNERTSQAAMASPAISDQRCSAVACPPASGPVGGAGNAGSTRAGSPLRSRGPAPVSTGPASFLA
jgi:hypothetical protein